MSAGRAPTTRQTVAANTARRAESAGSSEKTELGRPGPARIQSCPAVGTDQHRISIGAEIDGAAEAGVVNAVTDVIRGTPWTDAGGQQQQRPFPVTVLAAPPHRAVGAHRDHDFQGSAAGAAIKSAPAPRSGAPGSGTAALRSARFGLCRIRPAASIVHSWLPDTTVPVGGNAPAPDTVANALPPSVDISVAPARVRTTILSPMAETRVIASPRRATGAHQGPAALALEAPATSTESATVASAINVSARRRMSEPIEPRDDPELQGDVRHRVNDHGRPERIRAAHQPAEREPHEERDRHKRRLGAAVADRQVGKSEDRPPGRRSPSVGSWCARGRQAGGRGTAPPARRPGERSQVRATGSRDRTQPVAAPYVRGSRRAARDRIRPSSAEPTTPVVRPPWAGVTRIRSAGRHSGATVLHATTAINSVPTACAADAPEHLEIEASGARSEHVEEDLWSSREQRVGGGDRREREQDRPGSGKPLDKQRRKRDEQRRDTQASEVGIDAVGVAEGDRNEQCGAEAEFGDDQRRRRRPPRSRAISLDALAHAVSRHARHRPPAGSRGSWSRSTPVRPAVAGCHIPGGSGIRSHPPHDAG